MKGTASASEPTIVMLIGFQPLMHERRHHVNRDQRQEPVEEENAIGPGDSAPKVKARATPARVIEPKPKRIAQQPRHDDRNANQNDDRYRRMQAYRVVIGDQHHQRYRASEQYPTWTAAKIEARPRQFGVPVEVLQPPHLGPRRIDAQGYDRQQQIDDPDAEIFGAATREMQLFRCKWRSALRRRFTPGNLIHGSNSL